mmetsp:Transcript_865/g.1969  ORF Transcript_865/g.1969 Transcript_865/m.1969 type:complete len:627 (+) Transcript_865:118-1998(+)
MSPSPQQVRGSVGDQPSRHPGAGRRTIKVLALHGEGSNSGILRRELSIFQRDWGDQVIWEFLDGTKDYTDECECVKRRVPRSRRKMDPEHKDLMTVRGWHVTTCHAESSDRRHWLEKFRDRSLVVSYDGQAVQQAERVLKYARTKGPFDILWGFSQATITILIAVGLSICRNQPVPWRLSVLVRPLPVRDASLNHLFVTPLDHPAVLCFGREDSAYVYARHDWRVQQYFAHPDIIEHDEADVFPDKIYAQVMTYVWSHCDGIFWQVVGGASSGGIVVRAESGLESQEATAKLAHGALVRELWVQKDRLRYQLLRGGGPRSGWVSITCKQKPLLVRVKHYMQMPSMRIGDSSSHKAKALPLDVIREEPSPLQHEPPIPALWESRAPLEPEESSNIPTTGNDSCSDEEDSSDSDFEFLVELLKPHVHLGAASPQSDGSSKEGKQHIEAFAAESGEAPSPARAPPSSDEASLPDKNSSNEKPMPQRDDSSRDEEDASGIDQGRLVQVEEASSLNEIPILVWGETRSQGLVSDMDMAKRPNDSSSLEEVASNIDQGGPLEVEKPSSQDEFRTRVFVEARSPLRPQGLISATTVQPNDSSSDEEEASDTALLAELRICLDILRARRSSQCG